MAAPHRVKEFDNKETPLQMRGVSLFISVKPFWVIYAGGGSGLGWVCRKTQPPDHNDDHYECQGCSQQSRQTDIIHHAGIRKCSRSGGRSFSGCSCTHCSCGLRRFRLKRRLQWRCVRRDHRPNLLCWWVPGSLKLPLLHWSE